MRTRCNSPAGLPCTHAQEWCAGGGSGGGGSGSSSWVYVDSSSSRHDPGHLVTHRAVMPLPALAHTLAAYLGAYRQQLQQQRQPGGRAHAASGGSGRSKSGWARGASRGAAAAGAVGGDGEGGSAQGAYRQLLCELDGVVAHEVDAALQVRQRGWQGGRA